MAGLGNALRRATALLATLTVVAAGMTTPAAAWAGAGSSHCSVVVYDTGEDGYLAVNAQNGPLGCHVYREDAAAASTRWDPIRSGAIYWNRADDADSSC
ncbi:hypothetical protein ODJ79_02495 [Actinoplanes sp. KI2]|uniref:hypothetical protein n=1 Tax=Actinoplanes sp. KI2 TaxID=2983315 RepID=UPI0021D5FA81|nr:hypothetical protein [Actinoplanes sp. KI2]MCU7722575.1 hypothetical protein [Actinoplanes sp. KI2]